MKRRAALKLLAMILAMLALGQAATAETAPARLSPEGDLFEGLRFFGTSREACDAGIGFIPDLNETMNQDWEGSGTSLGIHGECTLVGRRWDLLIDIGDAMSVMIFTQVEPERATELFQAIDARLTEKWGSFTNEAFLDEDYDASQGGASGMVADYNAPYMRQWHSGGCICTMVLRRLANEDIEFLISFDKPSWLKLKKSESPPEASAAADTVYFRASRWGMSFQDVRALENGLASKFPPNESITPGTAQTASLSGVEVLPGFTANANYCFTRDGLFAGGYEYTQKHPDPDDYLDDYAILKKWLILRYGQPVAGVVSLDGWIQPADAELHGGDVADGKLELISRFQAPGTDVVLSLTGASGEITLAENYHDAANYPVLDFSAHFPGK